MSASPVTAFVDADIAGFGPGVLRMRGERIVAVGTRAEPSDRIIDLAGDRLLPGLINAHDHLHRNHFPRLKYRARHANALEWAADIDARRATDPVFAECAAVPRAVRLSRGAFKNLLSGVTTVAHHDVACPEFTAPDFPVRVLARSGWAHSLAIDGATRVRASWAATPADAPWFIHAGEGTDTAAACEAEMLDALGVLAPNTVLVHGLAFDAARRARLIARGVGLVWCPGSNDFLFGALADVADFARAGRLALGSDSRLSGERDLLDEIRFARSTGAVADELLESLVTTRAAHLLRLPDHGALRAGAMADLIVLPRDSELWDVRRADVRCVVMNGALRCGDADLADALASLEATVNISVDGRPKRLARELAAWLAHPATLEPGVELLTDAVQAA